MVSTPAVNSGFDNVDTSNDVVNASDGVGKSIAVSLSAAFVAEDVTELKKDAKQFSDSSHCSSRTLDIVSALKLINDHRSSHDCDKCPLKLIPSEIMSVATSNSDSITVNAFYDIVTLHVLYYRYVYVTVKVCQDAVEFSSASRCCFSAPKADSGKKSVLPIPVQVVSNGKIQVVFNGKVPEFSKKKKESSQNKSVHWKSQHIMYRFLLCFWKPKGWCCIL